MQLTTCSRQHRSSPRKEETRNVYWQVHMLITMLPQRQLTDNCASGAHLAEMLGRLQAGGCILELTIGLA